MLIEHNTKNSSDILSTIPYSLFPIPYSLFPLSINPIFTSQI
ncbi:hypothetical protein [Moorena sp. SIO4G3]|nr:hypothetical protein [Moorena sp. SIO4G3]